MANDENDYGYLPPWNFHWMVKGELATMGCPRSRANMRFIEDQGISHLVTVCAEKKPNFEYFPKYLKWTNIEAPEFEPPTLGQILTFIKICDVCSRIHKAVGVHCNLGRGRSGVMAACYFVHFYDMSPSDAITQVLLRSPGALETLAQEKAVESYHKHLRRETRRLSPDVNTIAATLEIHPYTSVLHRYRPELK